MFVRCHMLFLFVTYTLATTELGLQSSQQLSAHQQQLINDREQNSVDNQDSLQQERIDAIKQDILAKLGLSRVPDVSGFNITAAEKRHLLRMYRRSLEEIHGKTHVLFADEPQQAKNFYSFTATTPHGTASNTNDGRTGGSTATAHQLYFNLDIPEPDDTRKETVVTSATLKLYKYRTDVSTNHSASIDDSLDDLLTITVCQKLEEIVGNEVRLGCRLVDTKVVATRDSGWIDFNVAEMVSEWIREPTTNFGLKVTILRATQPTVVDDRGFIFSGESTTHPPHHDTSGDHHAQPTHRVRHLHDNLPLLNVIAQERLIVPSSQRMKRSLTPERQNCTIGDLYTGCCRYAIWVNFTAIGWNNWIMEPEGYFAYYCYGQCPLRNTITHTNYAYIRSTLHRVHRHRNRIPGPMCSATESKPLSIATSSSDGRMVVSLLDDMVVQTCKCV